jgi:2-methylcitrate dehydratase PrpD
MAVTRKPARVEIEAGGRRFDREVLHPPGDPESDFGWDDVIAKFRRVVSSVLERREAEDLAARMRTLDEATELSLGI